VLRRASRAVAALAAALVLAACSGGDGSSGSGSPTGDAAQDGTSAASSGDATPGSEPSPYLPVPAGVPARPRTYPISIADIDAALAASVPATAAA